MNKWCFKIRIHISHILKYKFKIVIKKNTEVMIKNMTLSILYFFIKEIVIF